MSSSPLDQPDPFPELDAKSQRYLRFLEKLTSLMSELSPEQRRLDLRDRGHKLLPLLREIHRHLLARRDAWQEKGDATLAESCEQSAYNVATLIAEIVEGA